MPIGSKLFKKNDDNKSNLDTHESYDYDIQINDFSDSIDLNGLGDLLGGGISSSSNLPDINNSADQDVQKDSPIDKHKQSLNIGVSIANLFKTVKEKFKNKKKNGDIPDLPNQNQTDDPNYVSETVSFADIDNRAENGLNETFDEGCFQNTADFNAPYSSGEAYTQDDEIHLPIYYAEETDSASEPINYDAVMPNPDVSASVVQDFQAANSDDNARMDFDSYQPQTFEDSERELYSQENIDSPFREEIRPESRRHDVMGAVRARIAQFCKRLPSFKPKEYVIPDPTYEEQYDYIKSPSLAGDIEKIIEKQNDLGEISREYENMRQYINSVDENVRHSDKDFPAPENINYVYAAQNELFDMIYQIGLQNEQQRSKIGVYEKQEEEDPYNYRGINDDRQNYSDIESSSFSMSSGIDFESEEKISPDRFIAERQQNELIYGTQFEDDFSSDNQDVYEDDSADINSDDFDLGDFNADDYNASEQNNSKQSDDFNLDEAPSNVVKHRWRKR